ncbi:DNA-processing protein DprA [Kitasatospora sp. NPDC001540]|uniref:DNA-processing protein DprA n=1 Tax=Kitasatospora sp. NPDC001540 TaxID=3364014 RepID=UPI00367977DE
MAAREVLTSSPDASGQGALFDTHPPEDLAAIAGEIPHRGRDGMRFVTILDEDYPFYLRLVHQRPPFLFLRGTSLEDDPRVALVGTREPTPQGMARARAIAGGLAERGVTVVSGLAAGIDTAAHRAALAVGGRTVPVIGTGRHVNASYDGAPRSSVGPSSRILMGDVRVRAIEPRFTLRPRNRAHVRLFDLPGNF